MLRKRFAWIAAALLGLFVLAWAYPNPTATATLTYGTPDVQSMGALAFGPDNLLFVGDSKGAAVFALDVNDTVEAADQEPLNLRGVDKKIAALLGTTPDAVTIHDMAVHPVSQRVYLSLTRGQGDAAMPVLLRIAKDGTMEEVSLDGVYFSKAALTNAPAVDAKDQRGRSLRTNAITDLAYADDQVYVAGLSNEEFASNFRRLAFPFNDHMDATSLEIFHVAHGRYETHAPVRTFMPFDIDGEPQILAAYTCTPLVAFPVGHLEDGAHVKGKTVAELGFGNTPLDIISFERDGKTRILIANTNRTVMMIKADDLSGAESLTQPLDEGAMTDGVDYLSLPLVGVLQMAMLNDEHFLVLQRQSQDGSLRLRSLPISRMI